MFKSLFKAAVGVVTAPVDVALDVVTLGGAMNDKAEPYTVTRARKIKANIEKAVDPD